VLECVVNVSEGRDGAVLEALAAAAGDDLLDLHVDAHHHRCVLTTVGEAAAPAIARVAIDRIDLGAHEGVHPRLGAIDVVPFVPLDGSTMADACAARGRFATWMAAELGVPAFSYGEDAPALPDVRRRAFVDLQPDAGPPAPHPTAGAVAVGCRPLLVAYNVWLAEPDLDRAREVAAGIRGDGIRALGLPVGERVQVSMNLVDPERVGPAMAYDRVAAFVPVAGAELVGLVPEPVLAAVDPARWEELDLAADRTIESRLALRAR
jgi:glutamate formiminotransferase / 5-formyltetrahydrofolate cyclo-ligase